MTYVQNQTTAIQGTQSSLMPVQYGDQELEQAVGISLLADLNEQLSLISETMKQQLAEKQKLRSKVGLLESFNSRDILRTAGGEEAVPITDQEYNKLMEQGAEGLQFERMPGGGYYLKKQSLKDVIADKKEELAGLNSNTELTMLQVQSLVDQRKNAIAMLSNLMSSRNESLMSIVRNMKN